MRIQGDGWPLCGACEEQLGTEADAFLCAKCLRKLPSELRRRVLNAEEHQTRQARSEALAYLGVAVEERRMSLPRRSAHDVVSATCRCGSGRVIEQKNFVTGETDYQCDKCGNRVPQSRRRPMAV